MDSTSHIRRYVLMLKAYAYFTPVHTCEISITKKKHNTSELRIGAFLRKRKMFLFLMLVLVLISPRCTLALSYAYA